MPFSGVRAITHLASDVDGKVKQYEEKFRELKAAFQERAALQTGITVLRVLHSAEKILVGTLILCSGLVITLTQFVCSC